MNIIKYKFNLANEKCTYINCHKVIKLQQLIIRKYYGIAFLSYVTIIWLILPYYASRKNDVTIIILRPSVSVRERKEERDGN